MKAGKGIELKLVNKDTQNYPAILSGIELTAAQSGGVAAPTADIDVSTDNGATWISIATGQPMDRFGRGSFTWTAGPATGGNDGLLRVRATTGSNPQDMSDRPFLTLPHGMFTPEMFGAIGLACWMTV